MIDLAEAAALLGPIIGKVQRCIDCAIERYHALDPGESAVHSRRTRSSLISDYMKTNATCEFSGMRGVECGSRRGQFRVFLGDKFVLRFKKLDRGLRSSNIPTHQATDFINQTQFEFPGFEVPPTNIIAGYQWNALETGAKAYIVCPHGSDNVWELELSQVEPSPDTTTSASESPASEEARRVFPKGGGTRDRAEDR